MKIVRKGVDKNDRLIIIIGKETFFALSSIAETNGGDAFFGNYHFSNKDGISVFVETMSEYLNRN